MRIGVVMPNWIGDAVMATPALRALRSSHRDAEIVAIHRPVIGGVLAGLDLVDRCLVHDPHRAGSQSGWRFVRQLRKQRFEMLLLLTNSWRSAWLAFVSGAPQRIGFKRDGRQVLLTKSLDPVSRVHANPVLDEYNRLAVAAGACSVSRTMELAVEPGDEQKWCQFWDAHRRHQRANYVCLNPGGAFGAAKHWPSASFGMLAGRIATEHGCTVVVLCGPAEREQAREIVATADHPAVIGLQDQDLSVGFSKALIRQSRLLVTTDSGPRHFAPPFGVPVVTLFGPTHIAWSETHYPKAIHLQHPVECGPCQQRICPLGHHDCMRLLSVDRVQRAVARMLEPDATGQREVA